MYIGQHDAKLILTSIFLLGEFKAVHGHIIFLSVFALKNLFYRMVNGFLFSFIVCFSRESPLFPSIVLLTQSKSTFVWFKDSFSQKHITQTNDQIDENRVYFVHSICFGYYMPCN